MLILFRYGVMHRNTFINSPDVLNEKYELISQPNIQFAGQMTGVEGYVESATSGLVAGINLAHKILQYCRLPNAFKMGSSKRSY
ncbi:FAD-dependent oxidoreductase, partial [Escherichia coli]|uniref:FAD-dependent oxidoreductase n=1 Tax=Escherichia coli TaxID=562 RepID=UPI001BD9B626